jgi:Acyltransferase family
MRSRLAYLDAIKVLLVVGVIAVHSSITYGIDGSWYLESYEEMPGGVVDAVTILLGTGWLFGLGLFFLIAGRLTSPSLDRKGPARFVKDRLIRLGIPLVAYTLLVSPALEYVSYRENDGGTEAFWPFAREQVWHLAPVQLAVFPQYVILFSLGAAAGRRGWLETLSPELQRRCGQAGLAAALLFPLVLLAGGFFDGEAAEDRFAGGLHWQAAAATLLEGVLATCLCLWAVSHFRRQEARYERPPIRRMAPSAYGAFIVHPPIIVGLAYGLGPLPLPAVLKFVLLLATGVGGSFGLVALGRRVLDHRGHALADADAHRRQSVARVSAT